MINAKKSILIVVTRSDTLGGVQTHIIDLALYLKSDGYNVEIVAGDSQSRNFFIKLKKLNINYIICPYIKREISLLNDIKAILFVRTLAVNGGFSLIHAHSSKAGVIGRMAALIAKKKVIFTVHGWSFNASNNYLKKIFYILVEKLLYHFTNKLILVSSFDYNVARNMGFPSSKLNIIHNSVPPENVKVNKTLDRDYSSTELLMVARLDRQKDHKTLLKALSKLPRSLKWRMNIIGDGPLLEELKDLAIMYKISDNVIFSGFLENISSLYSNFDIFVLASNWEGFPITTLEAMRSGLPIIVSNVGGSSEAVIHGYNGLIFKKNSAKQLSMQLKTLIESKSLQEKFSRNSKLIYERVFSYKIFYNKTKYIIDSVINS